MSNMMHDGIRSPRMLVGSFLVVCLVLWFGNESAGDAGINYRNRGMGKVPDQSTVSTSIGKTMPLEFTRLFSGTVGNRLRINMELTRSGSKLRGYVLGSQETYLGSWVQARIQGSIDRAGNITAEVKTDKPIGTLRGKVIKEVAAGRRTLRFIGKLTRAVDGGVVSMESTDWLIPGHDFSLVPARKYSESPQHNYVEDIYYPQIQPANGSAALEFNRSMHTRWNKEFPSDIQTLEESPQVDGTSKEGEELPPALGESFLHVNWSLGIARSDFISILFHTTSLGRGAVHSIDHYSTVNYDMRTVRIVDLRDLFLPDSDYLKVISDYCIAELVASKRSEEAWVKEGAGPTERSFETWLVVPEGLRILFSTYQVACFAAGGQEVVVPFSVFERLLKPEKRRLFQP